MTKGVQNKFLDSSQRDSCHCSFNQGRVFCECTVSVRLETADMTECGSYDAASRRITSLYHDAGLLIGAGGYYLSGAAKSCLTIVAVGTFVIVVFYFAFAVC